jgi:hypothetical protein
MLFKHRRQLEQLRKNGRKGTAEILSINRQQAEQMPEKNHQGLEFVYAADLAEVVRRSLTRKPVKGFAGPT